MVGRAEFAYLIAQMAVAANMIDEITFSITIWALLYATVLAPFVFRTVLNRYIQAEGIETSPSVWNSDEDESEADDLAFVDSRLEQADATGKDHDPEAPGIDDLGKILPEDGLDKEPLHYIGEDELAPDMDSMSPATIKRRVVKLWFARAPERKVNEQNGFLCCFFFKKGILQ